MRWCAPSATQWRPLSPSCACNPPPHPELQNCNTLHERSSAVFLWKTVTLCACTTGPGRVSLPCPAAAASLTAAGANSRQKKRSDHLHIALCASRCVRRRDMVKASVAMGLCVAMRPTCIMLWMMLALLYLQVRLRASRLSAAAAAAAAAK